MRISGDQNICIWLIMLLVTLLGLNEAVPIRLDRRDRYELARSGAVVFDRADVNDWQVPLGGSKELEFRVYRSDQAQKFSQVLSMCRFDMGAFFRDYHDHFNGTAVDADALESLPAQASGFYDGREHNATFPLSVVLTTSPPYEQAQNYLGHLVDNFVIRQREVPLAVTFATFGCCRMEMPIACKTAAWLISEKGVTHIGEDGPLALTFERQLMKKAEILDETELEATM